MLLLTDRRLNWINTWLGWSCSACLYKGRHLLLDKTATSAKGLLSPLISLTPPDSEITIPQPECIYRGKISREAILSWNASGCIYGYCCGEDGFCRPPHLPFLRRVSLRKLCNPSLLWPLTFGHWYSESGTVFDIYTRVPYLIFSSFLHLLNKDNGTNGISLRVCFLKALPTLNLII